VRQGGHDVPEGTIRKSYEAGLRNFVETYQALADRWSMHQNTHSSGVQLIARGSAGQVEETRDEALWIVIRRSQTNA
jgi:predicted ABC-type ATPase